MFPDYVLKYKKKGYKIIKKNDSYVLYKTTSKRVPGMKYPQAVNTYLGIITEEGLISPKTRINEIKEYEFGLCMYLLKIASDSLKEYGTKVIVKGILITIYGIHIFQFHYDKSYLSILYPGIKIDYTTSVDKELSRKILHRIDNNDYSKMFLLSAILIENRWYLANVNQENKIIMERLNIHLNN